MPRITQYPTPDGSFYIHHCQKPGPKPLPKELKRRRADITLSPFAIKAATEKAAAEGLSFSRYLEKLIYDDCIHIQSAYSLLDCCWIIMREENDWRLQGQEKYLKGILLRWKQYSRYSESWEHDHCEFCWAKFMEGDDPDVLHEGYATEDNYRWICEPCFEDFKDLFGWEAMRAKGSDASNAI